MKTIEQRVAELEAVHDITFTTNILIRAEIESFDELFPVAAKGSGWGDEQIAAFLELHRRTKLKKLEEMLISIENISPSYAAKLQGIIDDRKKGGKPN